MPTPDPYKLSPADLETVAALQDAADEIFLEVLARGRRRPTLLDLDEMSEPPYDEL